MAGGEATFSDFFNETMGRVYYISASSSRLFDPPVNPRTERKRRATNNAIGKDANPLRKQITNPMESRRERG